MKHPNPPSPQDLKNAVKDARLAIREAVPVLNVALAYGNMRITNDHLNPRTVVQTVKDASEAAARCCGVNRRLCEHEADLRTMVQDLRAHFCLSEDARDEVEQALEVAARAAEINSDVRHAVEKARYTARLLNANMNRYMPEAVNGSP